MTTFEMSPEKYIEKYIYNKKERISRNMSYGSQMAKGLEDEEATGDPLLDLMMVRLPKFELMDVPFEAELPDKKDIIRILARPDTAKADYTAFKEYKTSTRKWTQKMADESGQIDFYVTAIWLLTKLFPESVDIELVNVPVYYDAHGRLHPTSEIVRLPTKRTMANVIKTTGRMRHAWHGIQELCKSELL